MEDDCFRLEENFNFPDRITTYINIVDSYDNMPIFSFVNRIISADGLNGFLLIFGKITIFC